MRARFSAAQLKRTIGFAVVFAILVVFGEQCSQPGLQLMATFGFSLSANPFQLNAPSDYPSVRHYVVLVDMSHSMVSGPCPQDVDAGMLFKPAPSFTPYDPNKGLGVLDDHRADGIDCRVNPALPIARASIVAGSSDINATPPVLYQTTLGVDYEADRVEALRNWVKEIVTKSTPLTIQNSRFLILPFTGGVLQQKMIDGMPAPARMQFVAADDPALAETIEYLKNQNAVNLALDESDLIFRYQHRSMGTSSPGGLLAKIYNLVNQDMKDINRQGNLTFSEYRVINISDGLWNDSLAQVQSVLQMLPMCSACSADPASCTRTCGALVTNMKEAWGDPNDQDLNQMNFNYGLIQELPKFYGSGFVNVDFVDLKPERRKAIYPGETNFFEKLLPLFETARRTVRSWTLDSDKPPFELALGSADTIAFKMTNLYVLNLNARLDADGRLLADSDGDGLPDELERQYGTDPTKARTNGVCLDSLAVNPAFRDRCAAMVVARNCDPTLDSDGDGLNECEEMILGTDSLAFDSDGDGIPDSLEWIYGFNPLMSDTALDSNSDGFPNPINFAHGLPPTAMFRSLNDKKITSDYSVDYLGKAKVDDAVYGLIWLDQYRVVINRMPTVATLPVKESAQMPLYVSRVGADPAAAEANRIPAREQLISYTDMPGANQILVLARMVDLNHPQRIQWKIAKTVVPVGRVLEQPIVDLSQLKQFRTIDLAPLSVGY